MRIEAQFVAALSYRIVRTGLNKRQRRKESLNSSLCSLRFLLFDRIFLNSHLSRRSFNERGTTNHQLFPVARHFICNQGARFRAYRTLAFARYDEFVPRSSVCFLRLNCVRASKTTRAGRRSSDGWFW